MDLRYHVWLEGSQSVVAAFEQSATMPAAFTIEPQTSISGAKSAGSELDW